MTLADFLMALAGVNILGAAIDFLYPDVRDGLAQKTTPSKGLAAYTAGYFSLASAWSLFAHVSWTVPALCSTAAAITFYDLYRGRKANRERGH